MDLASFLRVYRSVPVGYYQWMVDILRPQLKGPVLEIGSGPGIVTRLLLDGGFSVTCVDHDPGVVAYLRAQFEDAELCSVIEADAETDGLLDLVGVQFGSVLCLNVLEHVRDDIGVLKRCATLLEPGGKLAILVPALPGLYGRLDERFGHHRRYTRGSLETVLHSAGLRGTVSYFNMLGVLGWWWRFKVLDRSDFARLDNFGFEMLLPLLRAFESRIRPPVGLSLIAVGERVNER